MVPARNHRSAVRYLLPCCLAYWLSIRAGAASHTCTWLSTHGIISWHRLLHYAPHGRLGERERMDGPPVGHIEQGGIGPHRVDEGATGSHRRHAQLTNDGAAHHPRIGMPLIVREAGGAAHHCDPPHLVRMPHCPRETVLRAEI